MGKIYTEKRGTYWRFKFEIASQNGKPKWYSRSGFESEKDAYSAGIIDKAQHLQCGCIFKPETISVSDYFNLWLHSYCKTNLNVSTCISYEKRIRLYINPSIGSYYLANLTPKACDDLLTALFNDGFSRNSLLSIKGILSGVLNYAVHPLNYIKSSPMQYVKLPLRLAPPINPTRRKCRIALTNSQIQLIFDRFSKEDIDHHLPLLLGYRCGMRIGEIFALTTWEDIDFETMKIIIRKQVQYNDKLKCWILCPPKYESYRIIDMDNTIAETLLNKKTVENNCLKIYGSLYTELYIDSKQCLCFYKKFEMKKIDIEGIKDLTEHMFRNELCNMSQV